MLLPAFGYAYDYLRNIPFVFTGSKAGLLLKFLKLEDPESPLFGRYAERLENRPFPRELALRFLRGGFSQAGVRVDEGLIQMAVDELDGVIGWLAYFGLRALRRPSNMPQG
ncbi:MULTISPECIES: ATP-binding protein [Pyrobaculum]|uniref:ATP-binding protein n=1 Tax=Pyrobaculum TaxID=2276 RepID=UPI000A81D2BD|nr:ATP-binding protein [Pyrobaculum arsenaticum]MCY0890418.1 ATP-binding protein [Pyrobaculum arsenaticum]